MGGPIPSYASLVEARHEATQRSRNIFAIDETLNKSLKSHELAVSEAIDQENSTAVASDNPQNLARHAIPTPLRFRGTCQ
ncbi:hypothetical protein BGZ63DRAFT_431698 [Mariannaea sp. PMI_226]|nr:hypothetical protein BGZ63DRAFT_431698 [Mariannaea sp. PMI_226]